MSLRILILSGFLGVLAACGTKDAMVERLDTNSVNYSVTVAATVLRQGKYDDAVNLADQAIASQRLRPRNQKFAQGIRAAAALHTGRYDQAAQALGQMALQERPSDAAAADAAIAAHPNRPDGYFARAALSVASGRYPEAVSDCDIAIGLEVAAVRTGMRDRGAWESFDAGRYQDTVTDLGDSSLKAAAQPYELLLLHLARAKLGRDDTGELARAVDSTGQTEWPAPVLAFYLGRIDRDRLFAAADNGPDFDTRKGQRCEAYFYAGEAASLHGRPDEARDLLEQAIDDCPRSFAEAKAAEGERARMGR